MSSASIRFSVVASALSNDPRAVPGLALRMGFSGVQIDIGFGGVDLTGLSGTGRREFRHLFSSDAQQIVGLRGELGPRGLLPGADVDQAINQLGRWMEVAAGLSAPLLCIDIGPLPEPPPEVAPRPTITPEQAGLILLPSTPTPSPVRAASCAAPDPKEVAQLQAALDAIGREADRYGVMLAWRSELSSLAALEAALRPVNCPWFGVDLDPVSVLRDPWDLSQTLSRFGDRVRHVRGRDAIKGADQRTRPAPIGAGGTDWPQLLGDLDGGGWSGWLSVDPVELPNRNAAAASGLKFLQRSVAGT